MDEVGLATVDRLEDAVVPINAVVGQVAYIQQIQKAVMRDGEHYGVIPGVSKPSLFKAGAEKLCTSFRLDPEYEAMHSVEQPDFILKEITCTLFHIPTGKRISSGMGSCNSREDKYRWRNVETDELVPKAYWEARSNGDVEAMRNLIGDGVPKKKGGAWYIARRMENDNPYDLHNTIVKMACKRALVAAVLNATAASDIFTQDVEDLPHFAEPEQKVVETTPEPTGTVIEVESTPEPVTSPKVERTTEPPADKKMSVEELRQEIANWLFEMSGKDEAKKKELLKKYSGFQGDNGWVDTDDLQRLKIGWARKVHHAVKEAYAEWTGDQMVGTPF